MGVTELLFTLVFTFVQHIYGATQIFVYFNQWDNYNINFGSSYNKKVYFPKTSN